MYRYYKEESPELFSWRFLCFAFLEYFDLSLKVVVRIWLARIISVPDARFNSSLYFLRFISLPQSFILFCLLIEYFYECFVFILKDCILETKCSIVFCI